MKMLIHLAGTRGSADFGWLKSKHTFSFGSYYDAERMSFGVLRVINDDIVEPGGGFQTHPHNNMEIISIPIYGALAHKDSTGKSEVIHSGDVQIMSAGTGIQHSEYNASQSEPVNFLQIWVLPLHRNIEPRYEQKTFDLEKNCNAFINVVTPQGNSEGVQINQNAVFKQGLFDKGRSAEIEIPAGHGAYLFVIDGKVGIRDEVLNRRDGAAITECSGFTMNFVERSRILVMLVPLG